jgi:hypothetical protein
MRALRSGVFCKQRVRSTLSWTTQITQKACSVAWTATAPPSFRASGLNLVVSAIVHWNTVYFARVADSLKGKGTTIPSHLLKHVSPISWEHTNLTETYSWRTEPTDPTSFRPLREEKSF